MPSTGTKIAATLNQYTTLRFAIPIGQQSLTTSVANITCTAQAGSNSNTASCSSATFLTGTSYTTAHEQTSVGLIQIPITNFANSYQRSLLKLYVNGVSGNTSVTAMICGILNASYTWSASSASWTSMSTSSNGLNFVYYLDKNVNPIFLSFRFS